jgi:phosphoglycolate phosphatase
MTASIQNVLFDLDGTLVDSSETIAACIAHSLRELGLGANCQTPLRSLIGMPLLDIFRDHYGLEEDVARAAIELYRARYDALEQAGTRVYEDMDDVLSTLRENGLRLFLATVKPAPIAEKVLRDLGMRGHFDGVAGSSMDHRLRSKSAIIRHVIETWELQPAQSLMVGDRSQDIEGARANGLRSIGVGWGFGSPGELQAAAPDHLASEAKEIPALVAAAYSPSQ